MAKKSLYISRRLKNADEVADWYKLQNLSSPLPPEDMHVTVAYSKVPVNWESIEPSQEEIIVPPFMGNRRLEAMGDEKVTALVFDSDDLHSRWEKLCSLGCSWDWPSYKAHITIALPDEDNNLDDLAAYPGKLVFGPERLKEIKESFEYKPQKCCDSAFITEIPVLIKAVTNKEGRRLVSVQASSEDVDSEGDCILQKALLDSADSFLKNGHIDIDHLSEIGHRIGIPNPASYIIGRPVEVNDMGDGRTEVVAEIARSADGSFQPEKYKYDEFWGSLTQEPPVRWRASIYGFPKSGMVDDCSHKACANGATRFLVRGIDWRSLAMTLNPINQSLTSYAKVVSAKSLTAFIKSGHWEDTVGIPNVGGNFAETSPTSMAFNAKNTTNNFPRSMNELYGDYHRHISKDCPHTGGIMKNTLVGFRNHFGSCRGMDYDTADISAHALAHLLKRERHRS